MAPGDDQLGRVFGLAGILQFLGASSIVAILTWSLTSFINHKNNQQAQLNAFISIISDLMINKGLDSPRSEPLVPPVSRAAHGFALNTLENFNGSWPIGDPGKKQELLKFLYDSRMIGYCNSPSIGAYTLHGFQASENCIPPRVYLKDAKLMGLEFGSVATVLMGIDLSQTKLQKSRLNSLDLRFANFSTSDLSAADLSESLLNFSDLRQASLVGADLSGASVGNADFRGSQLCAANLNNVTGLETAKLTGATFDRFTKMSPKQKILLVQKGALRLPCRSKTA